MPEALDLGVTHIVTAEAYRPLTNEELLAKALTGRHDDVVLASKFGFMSPIVFSTGGRRTRGSQSSGR